MNLSKNQIGDRRAKYLSEALTINTIDLCSNQIWDTGAKYISEALATNKTFIQLYLDLIKLEIQELNLY